MGDQFEKLRGFESRELIEAFYSGLHDPRRQCDNRPLDRRQLSPGPNADGERFIHRDPRPSYRPVLRGLIDRQGAGLILRPGVSKESR